MRVSRAFWLAASFAVSILLIVIFVAVTKIDLRETYRQFLAVSWIAFAKLVILTGFHVYLSNQKWRTIDAAVRSSADSVPSTTLTYALTSCGVALGQLLPVQLAMAGVRTFGTYFHGRALKRGTISTLYEQSFDVLVVSFLVVASGATKLLRGGGAIWLTLAVFVLALAFPTLNLLVRLTKRLSARLGDVSAATTNRLGGIAKKISQLEHSGLLQVRLAHHLLFLSILRFAIQVLMAKQTADAIGAQIELWQLAAAIPFVVIACVIVLTPGGLGVNEITYATSLHLFRTPVAVGAQWALTNRLLVTSACFVVAILAIGALMVSSAAKSNNHDLIRKVPNG